MLFLTVLRSYGKHPEGLSRAGPQAEPGALTRSRPGGLGESPSTCAHVLSRGAGRCYRGKDSRDTVSVGLCPGCSHTEQHSAATAVDPCSSGPLSWDWPWYFLGAWPYQVLCLLCASVHSSVSAAHHRVAMGIDQNLEQHLEPADPREAVAGSPPSSTAGQTEAEITSAPRSQSYNCSAPGTHRSPEV